MLKLYITRHGETVWNTQQRLQGWKDSELTERGIYNAKLLGERLKEIEFQAVYSSPSKRTLATASYIMGENKTAITEDDNLREIHMGHWEGRTAEEIIEEEADNYERFFYSPHLFEATTGESYENVESRVKHILQRITTEHSSGNILVVTHTVIIKMLLKHIKNIPLEQLWGDPYIHDTSLTVLEIENGQMKFVLEGDISHRA